MCPSAIATAVLIAASANNLVETGCAIGFGGVAAAERPAFLLAALALLGFAAAAVYPELSKGLRLAGRRESVGTGFRACQELINAAKAELQRGGACFETRPPALLSMR